MNESSYLAKNLAKTASKELLALLDVLEALCRNLENSCKGNVSTSIDRPTQVILQVPWPRRYALPLLIIGGVIVIYGILSKASEEIPEFISYSEKPQNLTEVKSTITAAGMEPKQENDIPAQIVQVEMIEENPIDKFQSQESHSQTTCQNRVRVGPAWFCLQSNGKLTPINK